MILDLLAHDFEQARELYADLWLGIQRGRAGAFAGASRISRKRCTGRFERTEQSIFSNGTGDRNKIAWGDE